MNRPVLKTVLTAATVAACLFHAVAGDEEDKAPYFTNVAREAGLAAVPAQRAAFVDINGDGFLDCVLGCVWKEKTTYLFKSAAAAHGRVFHDFTGESRIALSRSGKGKRAANVMLFADVDNDGDMDAFSGMYCDFENPDWKGDREELSAILLNDGEGVFKHLERSGVYEHPATTCAASFLDYNCDGLLDLFVGNWYRRYGASIEAFQDRLYRGLGRGRFIDATEKAGLRTLDEAGKRASSKPVYGAGHCDFDNDGDQDILVCSYGRQWNFLWKNLGNGRFEDAGRDTGFSADNITHGRHPEWIKERYRKQGKEFRPDEQPFRSGGNTFSVAAADYDRDGDLDLFLGEITHGWAGESSDLSSLLVNRGREKGFVFERRPHALSRKHAHSDNWNQGDMHVAFMDFDNDGLEDLLISSGDYPDGQQLRLFRQAKNHEFEEVTDRCGFDWESSSGISVADYDRDGDLDILAGKSWMRMPSERRAGDHPAPALFRNERGNRNSWIAIKLCGTGKGGSNRMGIGARIEVVTGDVTQVSEIRGGMGHCGQFNPPEAHFGLGKAELIDKITVRWPDARNTIQSFEKVKPNRLVLITEGGGMKTVGDGLVE